MATSFEAAPQAVPTTMPGLSAASYLGRAFLLAGIMLGLVAAIMLSVDAFSLFKTRLVPEKIFPQEWRIRSKGDRTLKALEIARHPGIELLFVGGSRLQGGFDPRSSEAVAGRTYNGGLAAATIYEQAAIARFAQQRHKDLKRVVWEVNFDLSFGADGGAADYESSAFAGQSLFYGYAKHLFGFEHLRDTLRLLPVLRKQTRLEVRTDGRSMGQIGDRLRLKRSEFRRELGEVFASTFLRDLSARFGNGPANLKRLEQALRDLKAAGIDVDVVLAPAHVLRLAGYDKVGLMSRHDDWKRALADLAERLDASEGKGRVRFFDFAQLHSLTSEAVEEEDARAREERLFYETSHYGPRLGDIILARLAGKTPAGAEGFGIAHARAGLEERLVAERAKLGAWIADNARDMRLIEEVMAASPQKR